MLHGYGYKKNFKKKINPTKMTTIIITGKYYFHFQIFYSYYHGANPIFWILFIFFYAERKSSIMNYESNHNSF